MAPRTRRFASSSAADIRPTPTIHDAPSARGSDASNTSSSSTSTNKSYDSFLIPDTDSECLPDQIPALDRNSRRSTWDKYLFETALQRKTYEQDRLLLREEILGDMKRFYGHERWKKVGTTEDVELYNRDESLKCYLDRLVLYGEHSRTKSRYFDRWNRPVEKDGFTRRKLSYDEAKASFFARLRERLIDDFRAMGV